MYRKVPLPIMDGAAPAPGPAQQRLRAHAGELPRGWLPLGLVPAEARAVLASAAMETVLIVAGMIASAAAGAAIARWNASRFAFIDAPAFQAIYRRTRHSHQYRLYERVDKPGARPRIRAWQVTRRSDGHVPDRPWIGDGSWQPPRWKELSWLDQRRAQGDFGIFAGARIFPPEERGQWPFSLPEFRQQ
jgi:hypothetical protein